MTETTPLAPGVRPEWERLYRGYADFYREETSADKLATLFDWLTDPAHPCRGLVAVAEDCGLVGLAHYRVMPSPLRGAQVGFLDDLFVDPYQRGRGIGETPLRRVDEIAAKRDWGVVRWMTRDNNYRARSLFGRLSHRSDWITYEKTAATTGREGR